MCLDLFVIVDNSYLSKIPFVVVEELRPIKDSIFLEPGVPQTFHRCASFPLSRARTCVGACVRARVRACVCGKLYTGDSAGIL